jgi:hypothetical protein
LSGFVRFLAALSIALFATACDPDARALIYGSVRAPGNVPVHDALVLISFDYPTRYYTWTNRTGRYSCLITEPTGKQGERLATIRAKDGETTVRVVFGNEVVPTNAVHVNVTNPGVELPAASRDSLDREYRLCD